ncbi:MAG TPA: hypothetical protein VLP43_03275 [Solirubrobacteraceae bacterium]|nr:hypothetical protein [Solirubrobacteraceae bacterium]
MQLTRTIPGGPAGNERLTVITGATLIVLLAVLGVTILRIGQLIWLHLFLGLALLGPLALKLASTGYRLLRYYTDDPDYRAKGPPPLALRAIAPLVLVSSLVVFASGVVLLGRGPAGRNPYLLIHKASFFVWLAVTGLHVLGHLPELGRSFRGAADGGIRPSSGHPGETARWIGLLSLVAAGFVLAVVLIPDFASWTAHGTFAHHHDH